MSTLGTIKVYVASQLGATDGATSVPKRDRLINIARSEFYSAYRWSFCFKSETVNISSQLGSLPSTYNEKFDPEAVYTYTDNAKFEYRKVSWDDLGAYSTSDYAYAINKQTGQIKISQTTVTEVTMDFYQLPADAAIDTSGDATAELAPDITPIGYLAIAKWWLSKERATGKFQMFMDLYEDALNKAKRADATARPVKPFNANPRNLGYTRSSGYTVIKGYTGRN